jgi:hypothetical protein
MIEPSAPIAVRGSKDGFRMLKSMCQTGSEENEDPTERSERKERPFTTYVQAFFLGVALGLRNNAKMQAQEEKSPMTEWIRTEFLRSSKNFNPFRQLVKSKFDVKDDREVLELMVQFAESGLRELYDVYQKTGSIDFFQIASRMDVP